MLCVIVMGNEDGKDEERGQIFRDDLGMRGGNAIGGRSGYVRASFTIVNQVELSKLEEKSIERPSEDPRLAFM